MPIRISDLAKRLDVDPTDVLAKAKELGITQAKLPSSSLDKITAEFLENEFVKLIPPQVVTPVPAQSGSKFSQPTPSSGLPGLQQAKSRGISIRMTGSEIHGLRTSVVSLLS